MGSCFNYFVTKSKTVEDLKKHVNDTLSDARNEYGSDVYSGQMNNKFGVRVERNTVPFASENDAYNYVSENTAKWDENVLAVPFHKSVKVLTKEPTFEGVPRSECKNRWYHDYDLYGNLKMVLYTGYAHNDTLRKVRCDQLTDNQDRLLTEACDKADTARKMYDENHRHFQSLCRSVEQYSAEFTGWHELKQLRKALPKMKERKDKLIRAAIERDKKYSNKVYKTKTKNEGKHWLVGSWCPE